MLSTNHSEHTHVLLCDWDRGESLNLLLVCRWGAGVLKLIEELKGKKAGRWGWGVSTGPALQSCKLARLGPLNLRVSKAYSSDTGHCAPSDSRELDAGASGATEPIALPGWPLDPTDAERPAVPA